MKTLPSESCHARRARRKRREYADLERRPWTEDEVETLKLHVDFFGTRWQKIAISMQRSPDSLRNKVIRIEKENLRRHDREARVWLKQLVEFLNLTPPQNWTRIRNTKNKLHVNIQEVSTLNEFDALLSTLP